ncbi:MAG TPA: hypothetical protein VH374_17380 [Polyangia bacterium]|jgi:hypothetical protein|nr:hypothetical protein [Polyangia bacterium]
MGAKSDRRVLGFFLASVAVVGCGGSIQDENGAFGQAQSAELTENALTANALTANALTANALTANALTANALTANALTANALTANGLKDPLARMFLKYAVSCALPVDETVTITVDHQQYSYPGQLGLAPQWGERHGSCDGECQRWVSACMLARVDAAGVEREISVRGDIAALKPQPRELRDYPVREGAYFGNLFVDGQPRFLCVNPGSKEDQRVCGDSLKDCPMTVVGSCDDVCDNGAFRSFADCQTAAHGHNAPTYHETVTVFLPQ